MQERHQRMLKRLAEMAMELAEATQEAALEEIAARKADPARPEPARDPMLAFSRMAKVVRQTVALEQRIEKDRLKEARGESSADFWCSYANAVMSDRIAKQQVRKVVKAEIERVTAGWPVEREQLVDKLDERLYDEYEWLDLARDDRSIGEIIDALSKELDLDPDWRGRWQHEPWAIEEAEENIPGLPYAADSFATGPDPP
jgi:isochorismate synthase EntC